MSSNLKVEITYEEKIKNLVFSNQSESPFLIPQNIEVLQNYYGLSVLKIECIAGENIDWQGIFFEKEIDSKKFIFRGGRFGFSGFFSSSPKYPISSYLKLLEKKLSKKNLSSCSLSTIFSSSYISDALVDGWNIHKIKYLAAKTSESVDDNGLSFRKALTRSNLSRNLKKAHNGGFLIRFSKNKKDLSDWYENCHLPRIGELNGKKWDFELLNKFINYGTGELALGYKDNKVVGGCFFLNSNNVIELFMLSSKREFQLQGVNNLLIEKIYLLSKKNGCNLVNWQASNPPDGTIARYKKDWNAKEMDFVLYNKKWNNDLKTKYLLDNLSDFFVFPYEFLNE